MDNIDKKKLRGISLVNSEAEFPEAQPPKPLTLKLLDDYVSKLAQFERQSLVGQETNLMPPQLVSLQDLHSAGKSAFKFKKPETESEKLARIVAPILKKNEGS